MIVPQYIMFSQVGLVNTFVPLILPKLLATDAFFIFLMVQFIRGIPRELDEAARIDGAGHFRIFFQIILPLMAPALAATVVFTFINSWNDFFSALIFLTRPDMQTVPVALRAFIDSTALRHTGRCSRCRSFADPGVLRLPVRAEVPRQGHRYDGTEVTRRRGLSVSLTLALSALLALTPYTVDAVLPAFPSAAAALGVGASGIQGTMTAYLAGLAIGQLVFGILSTDGAAVAPSSPGPS